MLCDVYELCCWPVLPDWSFSSSDPVLYYFLLLSTHSAWLNFTSCSWPYATSLIHSFVASCIDYCDTVLAGAPKVTSNKLQWVLNAAARVVSGTHKFDWGLSRFLRIELHWLDIPERVVYKLGIMVFNCLHGQAPPYFAELFQPVTGVASRQHLRSATRQLLDVPGHRLSSYGRWDFLWLVCWSGIPCRTACGIRLLAGALLDNLWRRFCSQRTDAFGALEVSRRCAI